MVRQNTVEENQSFRTLSEICHQLFDLRKVNQLVYETGFCQRRSKLQGHYYKSLIMDLVVVLWVVKYALLTVYGEISNCCEEGTHARI